MPTKLGDPPTRARGTPRALLLEAIRDRGQDRADLAGITGLSQRQVADALTALNGQVTIEDGIVSMRDAPEPAREPARRGPDGVRLRLRAEERARLADNDPAVCAYRQEVLGGQLLAWHEVPAWVEERSQSGQRIEHITSSVGAEPRIIRYERPAVEYAGPDHSRVQRVCSSSSLERLRALSEHLAHVHGWLTSQATNYVLAGVTPVTGVRVTTRHSFGRAGESRTYTASGDLADDPEIAAIAVRKARTRQSVTRQRTPSDAERLATLAEFAAEHGHGADAWHRWRREHPAWQYATRQSFRRAAQRAAG